MVHFFFQLKIRKHIKRRGAEKKKPKEWKAISKNNKWHKNLLFTDESPKKVVHPICRQSLFHFILSFFLPFFPPFSHYFSFTLLYSYNMGIRNRIHSFFFCFNGDAKRNRWLQNFFHITELFNIQLLKQHCLILTLASKRIIGKRFGSKNFIIEPRVRQILSLSLSLFNPSWTIFIAVECTAENWLRWYRETITKYETLTRQVWKIWKCNSTMVILMNFREEWFSPQIHHKIHSYTIHEIFFHPKVISFWIA